MAISSSNIFNLEGIRLPADAFVVLVRTSWNAGIVDELEKGCISVLSQNNIRFQVITVPGAFEIGFAIRACWDHGTRPDAFIALGCVLRGDTPHFDYVCGAVTDNIAQLNISLPAPVIFGVLTVDNRQQAIDRTGGKHGHKGEEAASTAIQMISLVRDLKNNK